LSEADLNPRGEILLSRNILPNPNVFVHLGSTGQQTWFGSLKTAGAPRAVALIVAAPKEKQGKPV
jgi:hypothetical protein